MLDRAGTTLPVRPVLPGLLAALGEAGRAVLVAPPGTGKTTLAPLALADALSHRGSGRPSRVVVAEPRRVATRAAAARMAALLGEEVGASVGYAVRGERRVGPATRVEVVTTGLLLRRLLSDPELPGVGAVLLDEIHERQLDADLTAAFVTESRAVLRPDLWLVAATATPDVPALDALLAESGHPAPVVTATAAVHPLDVRYRPTPRPVRPPLGLAVDPALLDHVATLVREAVAELPGDVLTFLPGAGEIAALTRRLGGLRAPDGRPVDVRALHGRLPSAEQDDVLRPPAPGTTRDRRVVLATSVAESSLTVPGVRVVVDAGLSRIPRPDPARGVGGLDTVRVSRAGAEQRAGRAAREAPGTVLRAWSVGEQGLLAPRPEPEVRTADLTAAALLLACWGGELRLPEDPSPGRLQAARDGLRRLGALHPDGSPTGHGRELAGLGLHPRLAHALLRGADRCGPERAAEVVALLSEDLLGQGTDDVVVTWRGLRSGDDLRSRRWRAEVRRLLALLPAGGRGGSRGSGPSDDEAAAVLVMLAHPERVARRRGEGYAGVGGTGFALAPGTALAGAPWLAVAVAERAPGRADARIRAAVAVEEAVVLDVLAGERHEEGEVVWRDGDVRARRLSRLGALVLTERPWPDPPADRVAAALAAAVAADGVDLLRWTPAARRLRQRVACLHAADPTSWPDLADPAVVASALAPALAGVRSAAALRGLDVLSALRAALPWPAAGRLDELAPETLALPSGREAAVAYDDPTAPVLAVKLQELFGLTASPRVAGGRVAVVVHLLSPAGRPLAVTADLESFWRNVYPSVRGEMRGRYPKHPWPEDPLTATPTARTTRRGSPDRS
ncbi:ATP-dependent helicase HrpB [Kineococcus gynurae]|uniref:ATP-dependent helicase HrpB n=1 Tax=Kineococcus gynurae TaxID=452979 RepID=A0ABV5LMX4_9ACTN